MSYSLSVKVTERMIEAVARHLGVPTGDIEISAARKASKDAKEVEIDLLKPQPRGLKYNEETGKVTG